MLPFVALLISAPLHVVAAPSRAQQAVSREPCLPAKVLRGATVVALGAYRGDGPVQPFKLAGSPYIPNALKVTGQPDGPLVLVIAAYEPVLWDLSALRGQVKAVIAAGYHPQAVTGVAADVPVRFSSAINSAGSIEACGRIHYADTNLADIKQMAGEIRRATGVQPRWFLGRSTTDHLHIGRSREEEAKLPLPSDLRTSVPIITEDDPERRSVLAELPQNEETPVRFVEWDRQGRIVRDEGGPTPPPTESASSSSSRSDTSGMGWTIIGFLFRCLFWLGPIGLLIWHWSKIKRWFKGANSVAAIDRFLWPPLPPIGRSPAVVVRSSSADRRFAEPAKLAALSDSAPLIMALHRYGREWRNVASLTLDTDMEQEVDAIVDRHFTHAAARYRQVRPSLEGAEAERADETLTHAVERLTDRLAELQHIQHGRDLAGMDEAARFIDTRHPA